MGRDKAWLEAGGEPMISRALSLVKTLEPAELFVSGRVDGDYKNLGLPVLLDSTPGIGPLAGIERALAVSSSPLLLVLAVDMPRMTAAFLRLLAAQCEDGIGAAPLLRDSLEPLTAIYPKRCHPVAGELIAAKRFAVRGFAELCLQHRFLRPLAVADADASCFDNCNTPDDFAAVETALTNT